MKNYNFVAVATTFLLCLALPAKADIKIAGMGLDGIVNKDGSGALDVILDEFMNMSSNSITYQYYPPKRASRMFEAGDVDCIFPGSIQTQKDNSLQFDQEKAIESNHFFSITAYAVAFAPNQNPKDLGDLEGREVLHVLGTNWSDYYKESNINWVAATNSLTKFKMLSTGRANFAVLFLPYERLALKKAGIPIPDYRGAVILYDGIEGLLCKRNREIEEMMSKFNSYIDILLEDGTLDKLLHMR